MQGLFLLTALILVIVSIFYNIKMNVPANAVSQLPIESFNTFSDRWKTPVGKEILYIESLTLVEQGMSIWMNCYEVRKTETGVHLEAYLESMASEKRETQREILSQVDGSEEDYREFCKMLTEYGIESWDGFYGRNPPNVLDGSSMQFELVLTNGSSIRASGSNNFPSNYGKLRDTLYEISKHGFDRE